MKHLFLVSLALFSINAFACQVSPATVQKISKARQDFSVSYAVAEEDLSEILFLDSCILERLNDDQLGQAIETLLKPANQSISTQVLLSGILH